MTLEGPDGERSLSMITRRTALAATAGGLFTTKLATETASAQQEDKLQWAFETGGRVGSSPTVVNGKVFVGSGGVYNSDDHSLYAVDAETGEQKWTLETDNFTRSSPTVVDGTVFVGSRYDNLHAVDAETGEQQWTLDIFNGQSIVQTGSMIDSSPTVVDGTVFAGSADHNLYAVDAETGARKWTFETDGWVRSSPTVVDGTVFVGSDDNNLYAVDAETGEQQWVFETFDQVGSSPTVVNDTVFVGSNDANLYAVAAETGEQQWAFETSIAVLTSPTVWNGTVFVGDYDNNLYAVDAETGEPQWALEIGIAVPSSPTVVDDTVFIGSNDDNLYAVNAETGEQQWAFETDGRVESSPTVVDGTVFVGSEDNNLYAVDANVNASSEGSRVMLGTKGHHDNWRYNEQSIDIPATAIYTSWVRNNPVLTAMGACGVAGGGYLIQQYRWSTEQPQSESSETTNDESSVGATEAYEQFANAPDNSPADSKSTPDGHLDLAEAAIDTAITAESNDNYSEAVDAYTEAISEYQAAIDAPDNESANRRVEVKEAIRSTRKELKSVKNLQERNEAYQTVNEKLDTITEKLDTAAEHQATEISQYSQQKIETAELLLVDATSLVEEYGFEGLGKELAEKKERCANIKGKLQTGTPPVNIPSLPQLSLTYDDIEKGESIGSGGNADVYRAKANTNSDVITIAIKEPRVNGTINSTTVDKLVNEAETWQRLHDHDHIVSVADYGSTPLPWIGMEYMDGGDLSERTGELTFEQTLWTALAITKGVRYAHKMGVAHLDLKPSNILFRSVKDAWDVPKVADWGLSKHLLEHSQSVEGMSPRYAAPEQLDSEQFGQTDTVTDVYQLGTVLYELFTDEPPFNGKTYEVMNKIQSTTPAPPSERADLPEKIDDILLTALSTERKDRYDDVILLRNSLREVWDDTK